VTFADFEAHARQQWEKVPEEYRVGVDGLIIERDARVQPDRSDVYTLGECVTEEFPSTYGGPDTTRSAVVLYYGSFLRLARLEEGFDWEREVWETITHELKHHLETMATEDALEDFDYAVDENYKRLAGEAFDPLFFRAGEVIERNAYRVEEDVFIESAAPGKGGPAHDVEFELGRQRYRFARPAAGEGIVFVRINGGPHVDGELYVVIVPRRGVLGQLGDALRNRTAQVSETEAVAEPIG
jgi:zinicin-like metallopeptidase